MKIRKRRPRIKITEKLRYKVIKLFNNSRDNRVSIIAEKLDISETAVHRILDDYFKNSLNPKN